MQEERILLYRDNETINSKKGNIFYIVKDFIQPLADELKKIGVDASQEGLFAIILNSQALVQRFKEKAAKDTVLMPAVTSFVEEKYLKEILPAIELANRANTRISQSELGTGFFVENLIVSNNWQISIDPKCFEEIEEIYSEYADSKERKEILSEAHKLMEAISNFQNLIFRNLKKNELYDQLKNAGNRMAPEQKIFPIMYDGSYNLGVLEIDGDGEVRLMKENVTYIR